MNLSLQFLDECWKTLGWSLACFVAFDILKWLGNLGKKAEPEMNFYGMLLDHGDGRFTFAFDYNLRDGIDISSLHVANVKLRHLAGDVNVTYQLCAEHDSAEDWKNG